MKRKEKWLSFIGLSVLIFSTLCTLSFSSVVSAEGSQANVVAALPDDESERKLTITKYAYDEANPQFSGNQTGYAPMGGVAFKIEKYKLNPEKFPNQTSPWNSKAKPMELNEDGTIKDTGDWILDSDFRERSDDGKYEGYYPGWYTITSEAGVANVNLGKGIAADGIYYVQELTMEERAYAGGDQLNLENNERVSTVGPFFNTPITVAGRPTSESYFVNQMVKPFMIYMPMTDRESHGDLIYDVKVNPKNAVSTVTIDKFINELGQRNYSVQAGRTFNWIIAVKLPDITVSWRNEPEDDGLNIYAGEQYGIVEIGEPSIEGYTKPADNSAGDWSFMDGRGMAVDPTSYEIMPPQGNFMTKILHWHFDDKKAAQLNQAFKEHDESDLSGEKVGTKQRYLKITIPVKSYDSFNGVLSDNAGLKYVGPTGGTMFISTAQGVKSYFSELGEASEMPSGWEDEIFFPSDGIRDTTWPAIRPADPENPDAATYETKQNTPLTTTPNYYVGGFDIKKLGAEDGLAKPGAIFKIAETKEQAENGDFIRLPDDSGDLTAKTDEYGIAQFNGLPLIWYKTDADGEPVGVDGKTLTQAERQWQRNYVALPTLNSLKKSYWLVETTAPNGYELLKQPLNVDVTLFTGNNHVDESLVQIAENGEQISTPSNNEIIEITIANYKNGELPKTGGNGKAWVVVLAVAFMAGSLSLLIYKKRQESQVS